MEDIQEYKFVYDTTKNGMPIFGILNTKIKFNLSDPGMAGPGPWTSLGISSHVSRDSTYFTKFIFKSHLKREIDEKLLKYICEIFKKYVVNGQIKQESLKNIFDDFSKPYKFTVKKKKVKRVKK